jgi:osmotically-inducible protein OsmY
VDTSRPTLTRRKPESIAKSIAAGQVVANEIAMRPPGLERDAKTVTADLDKGIEQNLDAALIQNGLHDGVKYGVRTGVVTLTGEVNSQTKRAQAEKVDRSVSSPPSPHIGTSPEKPFRHACEDMRLRQFT